MWHWTVLSQVKLQMERQGPVLPLEVGFSSGLWAATPNYYKNM